MCPLRVVVIFLSCLVALIALIYAFWDDEPAKPQFDKDGNEIPAKTVKELIYDFATGRYLWAWYKKNIRGEEAECEPAAQLAGLELSSDSDDDDDGMELTDPGSEKEAMLRERKTKTVAGDD